MARCWYTDFPLSSPGAGFFADSREHLIARSSQCARSMRPGMWNANIVRAAEGVNQRLGSYPLCVKYKVRDFAQARLAKSGLHPSSTPRPDESHAQAVLAALLEHEDRFEIGPHDRFWSPDRTGPWFLRSGLPKKLAALATEEKRLLDLHGVDLDAVFAKARAGGFEPRGRPSAWIALDAAVVRARYPAASAALGEGAVEAASTPGFSRLRPLGASDLEWQLLFPQGRIDMRVPIVGKDPDAVFRDIHVASLLLGRDAVPFREDPKERMRALGSVAALKEGASRFPEKAAAALDRLASDPACLRVLLESEDLAEICRPLAHRSSFASYAAEALGLSAKNKTNSLER